MPANADPFGEDSMIGFVTGTLNDANAFFGGRYTVVCKSPVTGGFNDANSGGDFGSQLRSSGYDAVFVNGISEKPVYLYIENGKAEIKDAENLWGLTTVAAETKLKEIHGKKTGAALIAPAGERMALTACVMNDEHRAAGRGGCGAVMGSKKLKAIAVNGNAHLSVADKPALVAINKEIAAILNPDNPFAAGMGKYGTGEGYTGAVVSADAGIKNWARSCVDLPEKECDPVSSQGLEKYNTGKYHCNSCPLGCGAMMDLPTEDGSVIHTSRPEYETMGSFGSMCLNGNGESVIRCNYVCNEYGLDTISAGDTIAWVMECFDKGILTKSELDGVDAACGNYETIETLLDKMAKGEGVGKILQNGSVFAADHFGKGQECLVTANGIEIPMHDSRLSYGLSRTYKYDPTPGRHVKGGIGMGVGGPDFSYENTGEADLTGVIGTETSNASGLCMFGGIVIGQYLPAMLSAVTGWDISKEEFDNMGIRSYTMRHAFNLKKGWDRNSYKLSERMEKANPPFDGPIAGITVDTEKLADNFFATLGWDLNTLMPSKEKLEKLGLENVAEELYKR